MKKVTFEDDEHDRIETQDCFTSYRNKHKSGTEGNQRNPQVTNQGKVNFNVSYFFAYVLK